jgi:hypothetical protein
VSGWSTTKEKGKTLLDILQQTVRLTQCGLGKVHFVDDADYHVQQVLSVKEEVARLGFQLEVWHLQPRVSTEALQMY